MNTPRPRPATTRTERSGSNRLPLLIIVVVSVIVIIVGGILISGGGGDDDGPTPVGGGSDTTLNATDAEFGTVQVTGDALPRFVDTSSDTAPGMTAPTLTGHDFSGGDITIGGPRSAPTMVLFLAHWCPHCNAEVDRLGAYFAESGRPTGVNIVLVPTGSDSTRVNWPPSQWLKDKKLAGLPTLVDSQDQTAAAAYGLSGYPLIVTIDKDGKIIQRVSGEQADGFFAQTFDALSSGAS